MKEVINVNSTDHWADKFKKMKKQNKYFTIGYNEFMRSKFKESGLSLLYLVVEESDLSLGYFCIIVLKSLTCHL
eukprot:13257148-Ditylum_brightwellii.AAC.1